MFVTLTNHENRLDNIFELSSLEQHADAVLTRGQDGAKFSVHRLVLGSISPLLKHSIEAIPEGLIPTVIVPCATDALMHHLINFIYGGEIQCSESEYTQIMDVLNSLCICNLDNITFSYVEAEPESTAIAPYGPAELPNELSYSPNSTYCPFEVDEGIGGSSESLLEDHSAGSHFMMAEVEGEKKCSPNEESFSYFKPKRGRLIVKPVLMPVKHHEPVVRRVKRKKLQRFGSDLSVFASGLHFCQQCQLEFPSADSLSLHLVESHPINSESFDELTQVQPSQESNTVNEPYKCDLCPEGFRSVRSRNSHRHLIHSESKCFPCNQCAYVTTIKANLNVHIQRHNKIRPFPCEYCGKAFTLRSELRIHSRVHTGDRPFKCEATSCGESFRRRSDLNCHMVQVHTHEQPHKCTTCLKGFLSKGQLAKHSILKKHPL